MSSAPTVPTSSGVPTHPHASVGLLAEHTEPEERGRAYAAHFALTHLFWLITYPASGYLARAIAEPPRVRERAPRRLALS